MKRNDWLAAGIACITLGLAPYRPEPHLAGKIRWVMGGAVGMQPIDWFDLLLHGAPFVILLIMVAVTIYRKWRKTVA